MQKSIQKILAKQIAENQVDEMRACNIGGYEGHDHETVVERVLKINSQLTLLSEDAEKVTMKEMARSIIPKPDARLKWIEKDGKELTDEDDMIELAGKICDLLQAKHETDRKSKHKSNRNKNNDDRNQNQNRGCDRDRGGEADNDKDKKTSAPYFLL